MPRQISVRRLECSDPLKLAAAFSSFGWTKPVAQFERYLTQQKKGEREVMVAAVDDALAGYVTILWHSSYPHFAAAGIPEIKDLNVLPDFQRQGIGSCLLDAAERIVAKRTSVVGIGFGVTADYGIAQQIYVRRGYIPDAHGLFCGAKPLTHGQQITVDDSLALYLTKKLA